jgi:hypothetical protein
MRRPRMGEWNRQYENRNKNKPACPQDPAQGSNFFGASQRMHFAEREASTGDKAGAKGVIREERFVQEGKSAEER